MRYVFKYSLPIVLILLLPVSLLAQSNFEINTPYNTIGLQETLQVSYTYKGEASMNNWVAPVFNNWRIISGPFFQLQQVSINGVQKTETIISYELQPLKTGNIEIPAAELHLSSTNIRCKPITILVQKNIPAGRQQQAGLQMPGGFFESDVTDEPTETERNAIVLPGEDVAKKMKDNIFIRVEASKTNCVVGEPILVTYTLYSRLRTSSKLVQQPVFNGCTVYEMTTQDLRSETKLLNGKKYSTYIIRKVQLIPLTAGTINLGIAKVENTVNFYRVNNNTVQQTFEYSSICSSEPAQINVTNLPTYKGTANFSGAIGNFTINARVDKKTDTAGDVNKLIIEVTGSGNFSSVTLPQVQWPKGVEHFNSSEETDVNKLVYPAAGTKTFSIPFTCKQQGTTVIPAIHYNFYNTETGSYTTIETTPIEIKVNPPLKNFINPDLYSEGNTNSRYIWIIPGIGLILAIGWWIFYKKEKNTTPNLISNNNVINIKTDIQQADTVVPNNLIEPTKPESIYELLTIPDDIAFFKAVISMLEKEISIEKDNGRKEALQELCAACNSALYAPQSNANRYDVAEQLKILFIHPA